MATTLDFVNFVVEQSGLEGELTFRKMFGEYALYLHGKVVALACDNSLFVRPSDAALKLHPKIAHKPPYPGAKLHPMVDELLDDRKALRRLLIETAKLLPEPKPKRKPKPKPKGKDIPTPKKSGLAQATRVARQTRVAPSVNVGDEYAAALKGWRRACVDELRAAALSCKELDEVVKWTNLVYMANGPVLMIRAEPKRVLLGFWRGQRLLKSEPRLKPGGKYEMATAEFREGDKVRPATVRRLVKAAIALNAKLGDPTKAARPALSTPPMRKRRKEAP